MAESFQPANGIDGADFIARWCDRCSSEPDVDPQDADAPDGCPILAMTFITKPGDKDYPPEWVVKNGEGICTAFSERRADWDGTPTDPHAVVRARDAYAALPRDPVTGRPVIA